MDSGLIFPHRHAGDGGTEHISAGALLDWRPGHKTCTAGKSAVRSVAGMEQAGFAPFSSAKRLPRKTSKLNCMYVRTANRHR